MATNTDKEQVTHIKAIINQFLQERLQPKLDKLGESENEKRQKVLDAYRPETWIANAAQRVNQIQQVTHAIKYTHPDAKGTSLNSQGNAAAGQTLIGTHTLNSSATLDVVGNAAALDIYKFLCLDVGGKTLLNLACELAPALGASFSSDAEDARTWMAAFARLTEPKGQPSSHKLAKQLYWPLRNGEYHLLAPLFPTTLVHCVFNGIREDRISEVAEAARNAHKNKQTHHHGYREYPNFAIQNFGGTKPQNISQLNSERHGENYLLASVPPVWNRSLINPPLKVESIFSRWLNRTQHIYHLTRKLRHFLAKAQPANNISIRNKRAELVALIRDEVMQTAACLQDLSPSWSQHEDCQLNADERNWLDPWRGREDKVFAAERAATDWQDAICHRFGNWLNARLNVDKTPMGDPEHAEWSGQLKKELRMMHEELDFNE
jgi:CRISPR-associated protein Csy1